MNWRGWRTKLGALWQRLVARLRGGAATFAPPSTPAPPAPAPPTPAAPTPAAPTAVAPTAVAPTAVAPTAVAPTAVAPTSAPPSAPPSPVPPVDGAGIAQIGAEVAPPATPTPLLRDATTVQVPPPPGAAPEPLAAESAPSIVPPLPPPAPPAAPAAEGTWHSESMMVATGFLELAPWVPPARTYRIYEPAVLAAEPCVLIVLHGCRQSAEDIAEGTRLNEFADARGWLVVYPEQATAANKYGCWNWFDPANVRGDGECAIIVAIQDAVRSRFGRGQAPTFLAGMSAGGALVSLLALRFPERWSGVAVHSGLAFGAATDPWGAQRAMREGATGLAAAQALRAASDAAGIPAIVLHGNADEVVDRRNAEQLVRQFLGWNRYFPIAAAWDDAPLPPVDDAHLQTPFRHPYVLRDYSLSGHAPVRECEVIGMGHAWSGGDGAVPYHDELGPDASALMMDFFAAVVGTPADTGAI